MACEGCPLVTVLDTAEEIIGITEHADSSRSLGGIAITRKVFEAVESKIECSGSVQNQNSQIDCPLREAVYGARSMATGPWLAQNYIVNLEKGVVDQRDTDTHSPGQYL